MKKSDQSDIALLEKLHACLRQESLSVADCISDLKEADSKRIWARLGSPSLFDFCHQKLQLTRAESYSRMKLVKLAHTKPEVISLLRKGNGVDVAVRLLAPYLDDENFEGTIQRIEGLGTPELEEFRNRVNAAQDLIRSRVRKVYFTEENKDKKNISAPQLQLPQGTSGLALNSHWDASVGCGVRISVTLTESAWKKYERVCDLSNRVSGGTEVAPVLEMLLDDFLKRRDPDNKKGREKVEAAAAAPEHPLPTRYIPATVKRDVWRRDGGQCSYVHPVTGQRCPSRRGLQFDHVQPYAWNGPSDDATNIRLLCPAHNRMMAEQSFGRAKIEGAIERKREQPASRIHAAPKI